MKDERYCELAPHIKLLVEGASGKLPFWTGMRLNDDLFVSVIPVAKGESKSKSTHWAIIFTESDVRGVFDLRRLDKHTFSNDTVVAKSKGKEFAVDVFTKLALSKVDELLRRG